MVDINGRVIPISKLLYHVYRMLVEYHYYPSKVAKSLGISRQAVNKHIRKLISLGLIECENPKGKPKFYKARMGFTPVIQKDKDYLVLCQPSHVTYVKSPAILPFDFRTVIREGDREIPICRVHGVAYQAPILSEPVGVIWDSESELKNGVKQYILKYPFKGLPRYVTFKRLKGKDSDKLIIWLPELYLPEYAINGDTQKLIERIVWGVYSWFIKRYRCTLGLPEQYRKPQYAFKIPKDHPLYKFSKQTTLKVETEEGIVEIDESKKEFPEIEFSDIRQAKTYATIPERMSYLEKKIKEIEDTFTQLTEKIETLSKSIDKLTQMMETFMLQPPKGDEWKGYV